MNCEICNQTIKQKWGNPKVCSPKCRREKERRRSRFRYYNEPGHKEKMFKRSREWQVSQKGLDYIHKWYRKKKGTWEKPCEVCGDVRVTQRCHIKPRCEGGSEDESNILYLCPTHHIILDNFLIKSRGNQFTDKEFSKIKHRLEKI